ncbi:MAG: response regulator [Synechococcales bacterium]|nr:response regulator [Synechococcales bacterium]
MKILLVEDDPAINQLLSVTFVNHRYTIDVAVDGKTGLELAAQGHYDVILLDIMVPHMDGISVCRQLRHQGCQTPILILTAKGANEDVVEGLDAGADDYVTKPCEPSQLLARIRALTRRSDSHPPFPLLKWGELQLDPIAIQVTYRQQTVPLSPKEYSLLELFLRHPRRIFSRSAIIDRLWSIDDLPTDAAVTNLVKDLRHKLKMAGLQQEAIETVYRMGYRLTLPPKELPSAGQDMTVAVNGASPDPDSLALINQVAQSFRATLKERLAVLEALGRSLIPFNPVTASPVAAIAPAQIEQSRVEAHRLAGGLGTFGCPEGSQIARSIEQLLGEATEFDPTQSQRFLNLLSQLQQVVADLPSEPICCHQPAIQAPSPDSGPFTLDGQPLVASSGCAAGSAACVLVIGAEADWVASLQAAAAVENLRLEAVSPWNAALDGLKYQQPRAILLQLNQNLPWEKGLALVPHLKAELTGIPVLILAEGDGLAERVAVLQAGGDRYLLPSTPPATLVATIAAAIVQAVPHSTARVMIVDDDPAALKLMMTLLQPWELQVTCLTNPERFWKVLTATNPDVLLLDLEMPGYSGLELCRVVRQDIKYRDLPILFVTGYTDVATMQQVFAAEADDFIGKTQVGPELASRVISHIEKRRMQRQRFKR